MDKANGNIAWGRLCFGVALIGISAVSACLLQPVISGNADAINTVVTVFSILAGFLIAIITFIGEPGSKPWSELQANKKAVEARLDRNLLLFQAYLITLGMAMAVYLVPHEWVETRVWLERGFVFCAVFVFGASFALPRSLRALQLDRYQTAMRERVPKPLSNNHEENDALK